MSKRVVITGGSSISPLGSTPEEIEKKLRAEENGVVKMKEWEQCDQIRTYLACPADWSNQPTYSRKKIRGMGRVSLLAVHSTEMALALAGIREDDPLLSSGEVGVSYGSCIGSIDSLFDFYGVLQNSSTQRVTSTSYLRGMPQTTAVNIGVFFKLQGRLLTSNTACTAGSLSIGLGFEAIKEGRQKMMICGGAEELHLADSVVFDTLFATTVRNDTPKSTPRPFDLDRDGLVVGEGAGTLILEELEHAQARGATIFAEVVGFGTNTDGVHLTQPQKETMQKALELALESASLSPDAIGFVSAHGTATDRGDIAETHATANVFKRPVPISSLKSYTGHTLGACGGLEAWLSIGMMRKGWFSPTINLEKVDPECGELDYIGSGGRELETEYIMSNNFAFGGHNTSLIFKRWSESS